MRVSKLNLCVAFVSLISFLFCAPARSYADTYQIFTLGSDQGYSFYGMDDFGHVVLDSTGSSASPCSLGSTCYISYLNGLFSSRSAVAPILVADNGTACTPSVPSGGSVEHGVCNNGRDAFTGFLSSSQVRPGVYAGLDFSTLLGNGGEGLLFMNALGDIVFDDHFSESWFEAIDLSTRATPEPGSLLLLATGTLAAAGTLRRRLLA